MNPYEHRRLSLALAVIVHGLIAAFVAFGVQWHTETAAPMQVELWQGIQEGGPVAPPPAEPSPPAIPTPTPQVDLPPPSPLQTPEIVIEKAKPVAKPKVEAPHPKQEKSDKQAQQKAPTAAEKKAELNKALDALAQKYGSKAGPGKKASDTAGKLTTTPVDTTGSLAGLAARQQAAEARAKGGVEDAYKLAIRNKIRRNMNYPDDSVTNPEVVYRVTLLPDMTILDIVLVKSSGIAAFDEAVKRAIQRTSEYPPLPAGLNFSDWRSNNLKYRLRD
ncbi:cell envelope integrity protein TolA [Burkholderiaceae bacterium DAT-1]|nr:cell envelope integrity protein TolA [Burkholderiaceae bacterium DAT-1]